MVQNVINTILAIAIIANVIGDILATIKMQKQLDALKRNIDQLIADKLIERI